MRFFLGVIFLLLLAYGLSFVLFVSNLPSAPEALPKADGIVALTGGGERLDTAVALLERGVLRVGLAVEDQLADLRALMRRYRDRPISLADACLVRLAELHPGGVIFTLAADFRIYRRHGNKVIPVLMPEG